jgi:hypothetical protein
VNVSHQLGDAPSPGTYQPTYPAREALVPDGPWAAHMTRLLVLADLLARERAVLDKMSATVAAVEAVGPVLLPSEYREGAERLAQQARLIAPMRRAAHEIIKVLDAIDQQVAASAEARRALEEVAR